MNKKNILNQKDPGNKKSNNSGWKNLTAGAVMLASVLSTNLGYNQDAKYPIDLQKKNTIELVEKKDSIDHEKIIHMNADSILSEYGEEKGMEILNEHMLIEINKLRKEFSDSTLTPNENANWTLENLTLNKKLCSSAETYAEYMYANNWFSHEGKDGSTFESRIQKTGYPFKFLGENLYKKGTSIQEVILGRKNSQIHYNVIKNRNYLHAGFGYYKGYRVGHFGGQKK